MNTLIIGLQFILIFFSAYWLLISFFGFGKAERSKSKAAQKRFAVLIPAHNEENVISHLLLNLQELDYPKEMYDIILIADNCNDRTAAIGREIGVTVFEHRYLPGEPKGKPYAIKYALDCLGDDLTKAYDAIAIFDADNLASKNYLQEMNNQLLRGERLIQCYIDSKNPNDNWLTLAYASAYYLMNRSWQLAKMRMGLGNAIGGTGFCVDTALMQEIGWTARSLTEDLEFTIQCLLKGVPATWCHHARVYDEKPTGFWVSWIQRLRWARGHWDVCTRYAPKLLWRFVTKFDIKAFDGFLYLINPGKTVLSASIFWVMLMGRIGGASWVHYILPTWIWACLILFNLAYLAYCMMLDVEGPGSNPIKALLSLMLLNITYPPLFVWGFITQRNKTWKRTEHTRGIAHISEQAANV